MDFKPEDLRSAFGRFATGVTIMSIADKDGAAYGVTANSFASVSLEPALILWCLRREATIHEMFRKNDLFAVNFLDSRSEGVSARYAASGQIRLKPGGFKISGHGIPMLNDTLTTLECKTIRRDDGGDHTILLAEILDIHNGSDANPLVSNPLVYYKGEYRQLESEKASGETARRVESLVKTPA